VASQVGFDPTGGRRESQSKPINLELIIVIHFKDYIKTSTHLDTAIDTNDDSDNNIVTFPEPNRISKEYIGKFVDQLMQMPEDPHQDLEDISYENTDPAMDVVAARILAEEKW
jgi:hypothetical protein